MYLDCRKMPCPKPVVLALRALESIPESEKLVVAVDNEVAVENLKRLADAKKYSEETIAENDGTWQVVFSKKAGISVHAANESDQNRVSAIDNASHEEKKGIDHSIDSYVIAIGTEAIGQGDQQLGKILMKGYIYALTQLADHELPEIILFFNGGAKLTTGNSELIDDLRELEERGVKIETCGTCLEFLGIKDELKVGSITNMYMICRTMSLAGKCIRI